MKTKSLVLITLFVLGCSFASAQTFTFGFTDPDGNLFCNYEQLTSVGSAGWEGVDNLSACGEPFNSTIVGFSATVPCRGQPACGKGVIYADNIYDASSGVYTGAQWVVFTKLKCNKRYKGAYGWMGLAGFSGYIFGDNYGYLSCTLPAAGEGDASNRGPSAGKLPSKLKK